MVNKDILLSKSFTNGISGLTHQLFRSYLENRQQYVTINDTNSSTSPTGMSVSQGSNFGPLLFFILINEIIKSSSLLKFNLFADEIRIYLSDCNEFKLYNILNEKLVKDGNCMLVNKLELNIDITI